MFYSLIHATINTSDNHQLIVVPDLVAMFEEIDLDQVIHQEGPHASRSLRLLEEQININELDVDVHDGEENLRSI